MGCKSSKDAAQDKFLNMEVKKVGVEQVDSLFNNIKEALDTCEFIRAGLEDSRDEGFRLAYTDRLVNGKYEDTLQVLLWALSANANGEIKSIDIKVSGESPFLGLKVDKLSEECQKLYKTFETYVKTIIESPVKLVTTIDKLTELNNQVPDAMNAAKSEIQGGSASFKEKLDGIASLAKNAKAAGSKIVKCKALKDVLSQSADDLKAFVGKLKDMVDKADEVGAKAHKAGHLTLKEIFEHYHTGEKKKEEPKKEEPKKEQPKK